jgi:hypothetical protein
MTCPDRGTWRAWLDGETAIQEPDTHLAACGACATLVAELGAGADFARRKMAALVSSAPSAVATSPVEVKGGGRWRRLAGAAAAVLLVSTITATPGGRALADSVLSVFRTQRIDLLEATTAELVQSALVLQRLGTVDAAGLPAPTEVATGQEAGTLSGLDIPDGLEADAWLVVSSGTLRWELDRALVASYLADQGSDLEVPARLDGTIVVLERGPAVVAVSGASDRPETVFARSGPVTAHTEGGASLDEMRDFLLAVPGLPNGLVGQLKAIEDWRSTLPLPVPVDVASGSRVDLGQVEAIEVDVPGVGTGYVWVDEEGIVTGIAGSDAGRVREIALESAGR